MLLTTEDNWCIIIAVKQKTLQLSEGDQALEKNVEISYLLDFYGELLSEKQRISVEMYYNDDLSLSEIAQDLGISRQGVRDSIKRGEASLYEMEKKLGLAERFKEMLEGLNRIKSNAEKIGEFNSKIMRSLDVQSWAKEIAQIADELTDF